MGATIRTDETANAVSEATRRSAENLGASRLRSARRDSIPPEEYDRAFYLSKHLEGFDEFQSGGLSYVKAQQIKMLDLMPGAKVLEVGYGRGELLLHCAQRGAIVHGVDYSPDAVAVAKGTLRDYPDADIRTADSRDLPYESETFDRVFSGDVIEHMSYADAIRSLAEMYRVVRPGGFVLVKTTPNTVFVNWVYPWAKHFFRWIDASSVQLMDEQLELMRRIHVDEYDLFTLRKVAKLSGMPHAKVWIDADITRSHHHRYSDRFRQNWLIRIVSNLGRLSPIRFLLGNDLYLECHKPRQTYDSAS